MTSYALILIAVAGLFALALVVWWVAVWLGELTKRIRPDRGCGCGGRCKGAVPRQRG